MPAFESNNKTTVRWLLRFLRYQAMRRASFLVSSMKMRKIDQRPIPSLPGELRLFAMGRNESLRLPNFLDYYFSKGVDRIFFIDNNSTDNSADIALAHDNVHVFQTKESFKHYSNWMEILLERYGKGYWCMAADLDEIFNYPYAETLSIKQLCDYLDQQGETAVQSVFLDMYSDKPNRLNIYKSGEDPLAICPYFDPDIEEVQRQLLNYKTMRQYELMRFTGNMRKRVFDQRPNLSKVPLFKYESNVFLARGHHAIDGVNLSKIRGTVMHFKYLHDFSDRVLEEAQRGEHENDAKYYKVLAKKIVEDTELTPFYEGSVKYVNTAQMVELQLMKSTKEFDRYIERFA